MVAGTVPNLENKLFVGGCPPSSGEEELRQIFEKHGAVEEVFIMRGGSRSGMACAFIRFATQDMAQQAIDAIHGNITLPDATEPLVVRWADTPGTRGRDGRGRHGLGSRRGSTGSATDRRGPATNSSYRSRMTSVVMQPSAYACTPAYVQVQTPMQVGPYGQIYTQIGMGGYSAGSTFPAQSQVGYGIGYVYPQQSHLAQQLSTGVQQVQQQQTSQHQQMQFLYAQPANAMGAYAHHEVVQTRAAIPAPHMLSPSLTNNRMMAVPRQQYGVHAYGRPPYHQPQTQQLLQGQYRFVQGYGHQTRPVASQHRSQSRQQFQNGQQHVTGPKERSTLASELSSPAAAPAHTPNASTTEAPAAAGDWSCNTQITD